MMQKHNIRDKLHSAWGHLSEGWALLSEKAQHALTHFYVSPQSNEPKSVASSRWGILAAELTEQKTSYLLKIEAPGMEKSDFDIQIDDGVISISGHKHAHLESDTKDFHILECAYGQFQRQLKLPPNVEVSQTQAEYKRGILSIRLPKAAKPQTPNIAIN